MNIEAVWDLILNPEVGGQAGRNEVIQALNMLWLDGVVCHSNNPKRLSVVLSVLDLGKFELITEDDVKLFKDGLVLAGYDELGRLID